MNAAQKALICFRSITNTVTGTGHWRARVGSCGPSPRFNSSSARPSFNHNATFSYVQPPAAEWRFGDGQGRELPDVNSSNRKTWDLSNPDNMRDSYRLLTSAIIPRPIALVSTLSRDGQPNLAPFRFEFSPLLPLEVSHNPPMVSVSFSLSTRRPKDTRENILSTKEFTISIITENIIEAANSTSVESPASIDEWIISGLTRENSTTVKPPLVRESPIGMECELYSFQDISLSSSSEPTTTIVLGLIKKIHVRESILNEDGATINLSKFRPVARLGGTTYARVLEGFDLPRISWRAVADRYDELAGPRRR
ncbi:hypothetical protein HYPSUDRAFT_128712 [Hypholoma sublateritium FD-334 SS-4]|uniref:Flavin reductase like domain-containing protein n=1 Tax=Hypholoma sublateritium (strain FD-334 SS-4) TaxID=945553 RepID=A0A0D2PDZ6_HYPSF|nr:hypothetical protein HYPSUDRAFT_128712 [Hypholoma sublateritium FD-334 SS-4]